MKNQILTLAFASHQVFQKVYGHALLRRQVGVHIVVEEPVNFSLSSELGCEVLCQYFD